MVISNLSMDTTLPVPLAPHLKPRSVTEKPASSHLTERPRQDINAAMDEHGGKGNCLGPSN